MTPDKPAEAREREDFEKWVAKDAGDLSTFGNGRDIHYRNSAVNNAWTGWRARASLATEAAQPPTPKGDRFYREPAAQAYGDVGGTYADTAGKFVAPAAQAQRLTEKAIGSGSNPYYGGCFDGETQQMAEARRFWAEQAKRIELAAIEAERAPAPISDEQRTRNLQGLVDFLHWCATSGVPPSAAAASHFEEIAMELLLAEAAK